MPLPLKRQAVCVLETPPQRSPEHPDIAGRFSISRQAVSKALLAMDRKVEGDTSRDGAGKPDRGREPERGERGSLRAIGSVSMRPPSSSYPKITGYRSGTSTRATAAHAPRMPRRIQLLWGYADELGIALTKTDDPTRMADELFAKLREICMNCLYVDLVRRRLGWCPMEGPMQAHLPSAPGDPDGGCPAWAWEAGDPRLPPVIPTLSLSEPELSRSVNRNAAPSSECPGTRPSTPTSPP